ncbi:MAG: 6-carboxytetrahydropterin synthase [Victivallales bacterium]|nr:6-carboxytetrahydropterin synthase [Victivallales bacterium]
MFEVDIQRDFSAAHYLRGYDGNCSKLHGHNWVVDVVVETGKLDDLGIAVDFRVLKRELDAVLADFDHSCLNDLDCFLDVNPTSECIAEFIFRELYDRLNIDGVRVSRVRVCESPGAGATYIA